VTEPLELAERALAAVGDAGDGAQANVTHERSLLLRFARSQPTQATAIDDLTVQLTAVRDGHIGSASTNRIDRESLEACARSAVAAAEAAARSGRSGTFPGFPDPAEPFRHDGHDTETARLDPANAGAALATAFEIAQAHGVEAHGIWSAAEVESAIASSEGSAVSESVTDAFMKTVCLAPDGRSGYAAGTAVAAGALDPRALAERAARKAAVRAGAAKLPPGEYPVVMEPHAVGELLSFVGWLAFNGLAYAEERSALCGRLGRRATAPCINLSDSPRHPATLPRGFDAEAVPKAPLPLIQDGVARRVVHDTRSAAIAGASSTGHALEPGGAEDGPAPANLVLAGGGARDEYELCAPIGRGVYVTRLWYVNAVRPKETLVTGVTRDGTFLIEDGRVTRPIDDLRLTDSALGVLERTQALSSRAVLTSDGEFYGRRFASGVVCPALRAESVRFTG
jgi:predicted Zn-dependent protease